MTAEISALVGRVIRVAPPTAGDVGRALGIALPRTETAADMDYFKGAFPSGALDTADLRINDRTHLGILVLYARAGASTTEKQVDMSAYGSPKVTVNPRIPPEGTTSYVFVTNGCELSFQFTTKSRLLRLISFQWPERS